MRTTTPNRISGQSHQKPPVLHVPKMLVDYMARKRLRPEMLDALAVMVWFVASHRRRDNQFSNIHNAVLAQFLRPHIIKRVREQLVEQQIVECDGVYLKGQKSFGYRISDRATESEVIPYQAVSATFRERLCQQPCDNVVTKTDVHRWLVKGVRRVEIDEAVARAIAVQLPQKSQLSAHTSIDWLVSRRVRFKPDKYGRVHSVVTSMNRQLRRTLHFGDDQSLVEFDIRCSQPFLLYAMLSDDLRQAIDALEFLDLCRSGDLYEALTGNMTRDDAKEAFFHFLFAWPTDPSNGRMRPNEDSKKERARQCRNNIARTMAARFPSINGFIDKAKRQHGGHKRFSHQMQRLESGLVIDGVCGQLMQLFPTMPLLTIHDSLLVAESDAKEVLPIFRDVMERGLGVRPEIKRKRLISL